MITGGSADGEILSSVESYDLESGVWIQDRFSALPEPVLIHCLVKVNDTNLLLIGGTLDNNPSGATANTYFFNILENTWIPGPPLRTPRSANLLLFYSLSSKFVLRSSSCADQ